MEKAIFLATFTLLFILTGCDQQVQGNEEVEEPVSQQKSKTEKEPANPEITEGKTCEDSDELDYYTKGELTICDFETHEEPGATSPVGCALHEDFCLTNFDDPTGKELYEYYCEENELKFKKYTCPNGCQDGACIR